MAGVPYLPFGTLLKRYRQGAGLTQQELAERARLSARAVSALERGVNLRPHRETLRLLADALGLSGPERSEFEAVARGPGVHPGLRSGVPPGSNIPSVPLVGRARELELIEQHLEGMGPPLLLVVGEAGIGKTRLLREAAWRSHWGGMTVLWGGCQRRSGEQPYSPLLEALARHVGQQPQARLRSVLQDCGWLVRLLPELEDIAPAPVAKVTPEQERRLVFRAVGRYLGNVAGRGGTLLVLDDLHWAGSDALELLLDVVHAADELPVRVVGAYRPTGVTAGVPLPVAVGEMAHHDLARRVALGPLGHHEAAELLDQLMEGERDIGPAVREQLLERAEGIPFLLVSLAQAFRAGSWREAEGGLPWSIAEHIRQHMVALPATGREVLEVAAVAGRVVSRPILMAVVAQPEQDLVAALQLVCDAGLLVEKGTQAYRFAHDVIREVIEADLGTARRTVLHRKIAEALEDLPGREKRAAEVAWHFGEAGDAERALQYRLMAGEQAESAFAHGEAEEHFRAALQLARVLGDESQEAAVREKLGAVLVLEAKYEEARTALERAAELHRSSGDLERLGYTTGAIAGLYSVAGWTSAEALERLRRLIEAFRSTGLSPALPSLYGGLAGVLFVGGRYQEQLEAGEQGVIVADQLGDRGLATEAEYFRDFALFLLGRLEESLHELSARLARIEASGDLFSLCSGLAAMAVVHLHMGELEESRGYSQRAVELAERVGNPWQICDAVGGLALGRFITGEWGEARRGFDRLLALGEHSRLPYALWQVGWLELAEGRWEQARKALEKSMVMPQRTGNLQALRWASSLLAELDLLSGRPDTAQERLLPLLDRPGLQELDVTFLLPRLVRTYLELGETAQATSTAKEAVDRARRQHYHLALADALRELGVVLAGSGCREGAERALEEATTLCRGMPYPYGEARALYEWGMMARAAADTEHAGTLLKEALSLFERLGERPYMERTHRELAKIT